MRHTTVRQITSFALALVLGVASVSVTAHAKGGIERPEKIEKAEKPQKIEKVEKVEKAEKPQKVEKVEKAEKPQKVEKAEKPRRT